MTNKEFIIEIGKILINTAIAMGGVVILFLMLRVTDWLIGYIR